MILRIGHHHAYPLVCSPYQPLHLITDITQPVFLRVANTFKRLQLSPGASDVAHHPKLMSAGWLHVDEPRLREHGVQKLDLDALSQRIGGSVNALKTNFDSKQAIPSNTSSFILKIVGMNIEELQSSQAAKSSTFVLTDREIFAAISDASASQEFLVGMEESLDNCIREGKPLRVEDWGALEQPSIGRLEKACVTSGKAFCLDHPSNRLYSCKRSGCTNLILKINSRGRPPLYCTDHGKEMCNALDSLGRTKPSIPTYARPLLAIRTNKGRIDHILSDHYDRWIGPFGALRTDPLPFDRDPTSKYFPRMSERDQQRRLELERFLIRNDEGLSRKSWDQIRKMAPNALVDL